MNTMVSEGIIEKHKNISELVGNLTKIVVAWMTPVPRIGLIQWRSNGSVQWVVLFVVYKKTQNSYPVRSVFNWSYKSIYISVWLCVKAAS